MKALLEIQCNEKSYDPSLSISQLEWLRCSYMGPVEYVFNRLQHELTIRMHDVDNEIQLENTVCAIIRRMRNFTNYFNNCDFV